MSKKDYFVLLNRDELEIQDDNFHSTIKKIDTADGDIIISINKFKDETIKLFKEWKFDVKD